MAQLGMSGRPAYQEVADDLRAQVQRGDLKIGQPIPSTAKLTEHYGVSTTVIRASVKQLQAEGVLAGAAGKGVYVRATPETVAEESASLGDLSQQIDHLREGLEGLAQRMDEVPGEEVIAALRAEIQELRRQFGILHTQVIDLYGRTGHVYPHDAINRDDAEQRRAAGGAH